MEKSHQFRTEKLHLMLPEWNISVKATPKIGASPNLLIVAKSKFSGPQSTHKVFNLLNFPMFAPKPVLITGPYVNLFPLILCYLKPSRDPKIIFTIPSNEIIKMINNRTSNTKDQTKTPKTKFSPPIFRQFNPQWKSINLGFSDVKTLGDKGCAITALASMANGCGLKLPNNTPINPATLNAWLVETKGFENDGSRVKFSSLDKLGFEFKGERFKNQSDLTKALEDGHYVLLNVKNGNHWVLATSFNEKGYNVMDPGSVKINFYAFDTVTRAVIYTQKCS